MKEQNPLVTHASAEVDYCHDVKPTSPSEYHRQAFRITGQRVVNFSNVQRGSHVRETSKTPERFERLMLIFASTIKGDSASFMAFEMIAHAFHLIAEEMSLAKSENSAGWQDCDEVTKLVHTLFVSLAKDVVGDSAPALRARASVNRTKAKLEQLLVPAS